MRHWWVNQGLTYEVERQAGVLWAPHRSTGEGQTRYFWTAVEWAEVGDLVFHYARGSVIATSEVIERATTAPRPYAGDPRYQGVPGFLLRVAWAELRDPVPLPQIPGASRRTHAPLGPFNRDGQVKQGYFFPLPSSVGKELADLVSR